MRFRWSHFLLVFLFIWLAILLYLLFPLWRSSEAEEKLFRTQNEVAGLVNENEKLRGLLKSLQDKYDALRASKTSDAGNDDGKPSLDDVHLQVAHLVKGPTKEYELARRKIKRDIDEMWFFVRARLDQISKQIEKSKVDFGSTIDSIYSSTRHRYNAIVNDLEHLAAVDGFAEWRENESKSLSALVQKRLHTLQNPKDCSSARKLVCNLNKGCGYGCQIHHAIYCFITAYGTERTLYLKSHGWRYNKKGFEDVFMPVSNNCSSTPAGDPAYWPSPQAQVVELPIIDSVNPRPKFLPPAIPRDLADRIIRLHGDPIVWWVSEFLRYVLRPQQETAKMLQDAEASLSGFEKPIVGIHVRRTDKVGTEAAFHAVEEYMKYVEEYFERLEIKGGKKLSTKRVYVASDDAKVLAECQKKFPDYTFLGDPNVARSAAVSTRYTSNSLRGILSDIDLLSKTDYLVCTFSSQVCRLAYEIMQQKYVDAADRFKSLDDIWYFGGQDEHRQVATLEHSPQSRDEIELRVGDVIGVAGNHWDGFNKGRNHRTNRIGLYPEYKTSEQIKLVDNPTYPHVSL